MLSLAKPEEMSQFKLTENLNILSATSYIQI